MIPSPRILEPDLDERSPQIHALVEDWRDAAVAARSAEAQALVVKAEEARSLAHIGALSVGGLAVLLLFAAASAAAAALETSLSHRDHAQAVTFLTGHRRDNGELVLPWAALASAATAMSTLGT